MDKNIKLMAKTGISTPSSQPTDLSIGIEFEYIYAYYDGLTQEQRSERSDSGQKGFNAVDAVCKTLQKDLQATCSTCSEIVTFKLPVMEFWFDDPLDTTRWNAHEENKHCDDEIRLLGPESEGYSFGAQTDGRQLSDLQTIC
jgi:hypothetical protein